MRGNSAFNAFDGTETATGKGLCETCAHRGPWRSLFAHSMQEADCRARGTVVDSWCMPDSCGLYSGPRDGGLQPMDPTVEEGERRAVMLSAALCAQGLSDGVKRFRFEPGEARRLRRQAELLANELAALERLCGRITD